MCSNDQQTARKPGKGRGVRVRGVRVSVHFMLEDLLGVLNRCQSSELADIRPATWRGPLWFPEVGARQSRAKSYSFVDDSMEGQTGSFSQAGPPSQEFLRQERPMKRNTSSLLLTDVCDNCSFLVYSARSCQRKNCPSWFRRSLTSLKQRE